VAVTGLAAAAGNPDEAEKNARESRPTQDVHQHGIVLD